MIQAFIAVGSNLGDRKANLDQARESLSHLPGVQMVCDSPVYETDPVGGPAQGKYLNAVWEIQTSLEPQELLNELLGLEAEMGRKRTVPNAPRTIDLDLLFYGEQIIKAPGLEVPHPRLHERWFVLRPLADIAPGFVHPKFKKNIQTLLNDASRNPKS